MELGDAQAQAHRAPSPEGVALEATKATSLPTPAAEPGDACRNITGCSASPSIAPAQPWGGSGSPCLSHPGPCLAFCAAIGAAVPSLRPCPQGTHITPLWDPPGVLLWQHRGFVVQEPRGLEVRRDKRYLGGKERQRLGIRGPLALLVGKGPECPFSWVWGLFLPYLDAFLGNGFFEGNQ